MPDYKPLAAYKVKIVQEPPIDVANVRITGAGWHTVATIPMTAAECQRHIHRSSLANASSITVTPPPKPCCQSCGKTGVPLGYHHQCRTCYDGAERVISWAMRQNDELLRGERERRRVEARAPFAEGYESLWNHNAVGTIWRLR